MGRLERPDVKRRTTDEDTIEVKRERSEDQQLAEEMSSTRVSVIKDEAASSTSSSPSLVPTKVKSSRSSSSSAPIVSKSSGEATATPIEPGKTNGNVSPKNPMSQSTKASRSASKKNNVPRIAPLFDHLPEANVEANSTYTVIETCSYQNKFLGYTEHAMECDCSEEWDVETKTNTACGEDSDCINRATKMECVGDCACGSACQNQRFGRRIYANVSVILTEKKGYGLRTNTALKAGDFIYEYIGEVIPEGPFRKRMRQYDDEGIKHFYFMSLSKGEFVDATKKGNLGRFCNHSCNPNCYVDKWVVGDKLRMGIFAERTIRAGEELVFNYNVDRYGANPQPCYCGESNCTGFIGGKTQTERATKLSAATIEALGIDDEDYDAWDTVTAKRPKKKKNTEDDDQDYVDRAQIKGLDDDGVTKVMAALMQCKEKWIAVKLFQRMQLCNDEDVLHRIIKLHGYKILNSQLSAWRDDENVILQILDILDRFPRLTRNKIVDAKIDQTLLSLKDSTDDRVASKSATLLEQWSKLELAYRIPRKARGAENTGVSTPVKFERRESAQQRKRSRSRSKSPPRGPSGTSVPTGPKGSVRPVVGFGRPPPPPFHRGPPALPQGWFSATDNSGRSYFYSSTGETTWKRPSQPATKPPPPPKQPSQQDVLKSIIDDIVTSKDKVRDTKQDTPDTPEPEKKKEKKAEKWRLYDEDKKKKLYENTLFPYISHVMNKYKHKIPRDDLKRFAKEIAKKLVNSDFKAGRVNDPRQIDEKQQKKVKNFCKEYFDKAAHKHKKHEVEKAAKKAKKGAASSSADVSIAVTPVESPVAADLTPKKEEDSDDEDVKMSDVDDIDDGSPSEVMRGGILKRKRSVDEMDLVMKDEEDDLVASPSKRTNAVFPVQAPTPPPPPPPAPPVDPPSEANTPAADDTEEPMETDIHGDTNFKSKSMADVLAQAQQEGDDEVDWGMDEIDETGIQTNFEHGLGGNGIMLENPLVGGQQIVHDIKQEQES